MTITSVVETNVEKVKKIRKTSEKNVETTEEKISGVPALRYQFAKTAPADGDIDIRDLVLPDFQGRASHNAVDWSGFVESIKVNMVQSIGVTPLENGKALIFAGQRRYRAAVELGWKKVPVHFVVVDPKDLQDGATVEDVLWGMALVENLDRKDLSTWDKYIEFSRMTEKGMSQEEIAKRVRKTNGFVSQHLAIGRLDPRVRTIIKNNASDSTITAKVRELVRLSEHPEAQYALAQDAFNIESPWTSTMIKDKIDTIILVAKQREDAKAKKAKEAGTSTKSKNEEVEETEEEAPFADAEVKFVGIKNARSYLAYLSLRFDKAKTMPDDTEESRIKRAEKVAYEKGRLEGAQTAFGLKDLPASLL